MPRRSPTRCSSGCALRNSSTAGSRPSTRAACSTPGCRALRVAPRPGPGSGAGADRPMPDRSAWLDRTREDALEPALPICDPHHHLWEHPGSRYLLPEFLADLAGGHRVVSTVYVECAQWYRTDGPEAERPVGETEFVERIAAARAGEAPRIAAGIVGFADLTLGAAVGPVLEAHLAASGRFRGVRYASAWDPGPGIRPAHTRPPPGLLGDPAFRAGFARLAPLGLSFDAWLYHTQFGELADLAR